MGATTNMRSLILRLGFTLLLAVYMGNAAIAKDTWRDVARIIAIGDIHGDYSQYRNVMQMTGLIDDSGLWSGGKTHMVQTGDIPDRGPDTLKILAELKQLQSAAQKAGGRIHLLLGNHEAMNITGDLRYVHPGEYAAFATTESRLLQDQYYQLVLRKLQDFGDQIDRDRWYQQHPPGYVEHRQAWQPGGSMSKWVGSHNAVIRINDILFVHGGLNPHVRQNRLSQINRQIRTELKASESDGDTLVNGENGPLWYRGYTRNEPNTELKPLTKMLKYHRASHIVVGHSPTRGLINSRFDGRVVFIDVGLSQHYGGGMAALLIENGTWIAIHRGETVPLAMRDEDLPAYHQEIESIESRRNLSD